MPLGNTISISLLTLLLLLAPGLIGLRLFYDVSNRKYSLTRTRLIVYSSVLSSVSALTLYIFSDYIFSYFLPSVEWIADYLNIVGESRIREISLPIAVGLYLVHISVTLIFGAFFGWGYRRYKFRRHNELIDRREPWEFFFTKSPRDGERVEVTLNGGDIIQGEFNKRAFDPDQRELFLDDPYSVEYQDGSSAKQDLGRSIYLHADAIQQVVSIEEDPNASITEYLEEFAIEEGLREEVESMVRDLELQTSLSEEAFHSEERDGENDTNEEEQ